MSRRRFLDLAKDLNITVPVTRVVSGTEDLGAWHAEMGTAGAQSGWHVGWPRRSDLGFLGGIAKGMARTEGTPELRDSVETAFNRSGSACPLEATIVRRMQNEQMTQAAELIAARLQLSGFYGLDFVIESDTNVPYLIELNPRCTQLGHLDFPDQGCLVGILAAALRGERCPRPHDPIHRHHSDFSAGPGRRKSPCRARQVEPSRRAPGRIATRTRTQVEALAGASMGVSPISHAQAAGP
jgi:hypothetical protein